MGLFDFMTFYKSKDSWFTMLCYFLLFSKWFNINFNLEGKEHQKVTPVWQGSSESQQSRNQINDRRNNVWKVSGALWKHILWDGMIFSFYTKAVAVANCWSSLHYLEEITIWKEKHLIFSFITPCQSTRTQKSSSSHKLPNSTWTWALLSHKLT